MSIFSDQLVNGLVGACLATKAMVKEAVPYSVLAVAALEGQTPPNSRAHRSNVTLSQQNFGGTFLKLRVMKQL